MFLSCFVSEELLISGMLVGVLVIGRKEGLVYRECLRFYYGW